MQTGSSRVASAGVALMVLTAAVSASAPQTGQTTQRPPATRPAPTSPTGVPSPPPGPATSAPATSAPAPAPTETELGVRIYPNAQFIASYDAGQRQRYYLFGANASFPEVVAYYRTILKTKGELVYEQPPIHTFDIGRFREETMAFPPSVTVKDYTFGGSEGYLVPLPGGRSQRFPTVIQIVPAAPGDRR